MESNGESGRVHVSPSTAELIIQSGKEYVLNYLDQYFHVHDSHLNAEFCTTSLNVDRCRCWLTPRENTTMVKGKGEMQTYWCDPTKSKQSTSDGGSTNPSQDSDDGMVDPVLFDI